MEYDVVTWQDVDDAVNRILEEVKSGGAAYAAVYGLPRGGLVGAVMLSHRLEIPLALNMEEVWLFRRQGKTVLIADDIADTGETLRHFNEDTFDIATLYIREHTTVTMPRYYGKSITHDKWLVFPWETVKEAKEK